MLKNEEKFKNLNNNIKKIKNLRNDGLWIEKSIIKKIKNENNKDNQPKFDQELSKHCLNNIQSLQNIETFPIKQDDFFNQNLLMKKNVELFNLNHENQKLKEIINNNQTEYCQSKNSISCQLLLEHEQQNNIQIRNNLKILSQSIGEIQIIKQGNSYIDIWKDGLELKQTKLLIQKNKIDTDFILEKLKSLKSIDTEESYQILKENYKLQLKILEKVLFIKKQEEITHQQNLKTLNDQKEKILKTQKKIWEENNCYFNQKREKWPLLNERYQVLQLIGKGGFSEGFDLLTNKFVALKLHHIDRNWSQNYIENYIKHVFRENDSHKEINHPNIVRLIDNLELDSDSMISVLEYCNGQDLSSFLKVHGAFQEQEAKIIIKILLNGLKFLHDHPLKIIHYDLKPQNIMFHNNQLKIGDFGLCKIMADQDQTKIDLTSQGVGTYWYLPPECFQPQSETKISPKVDIWSIGVIFFEMLYAQRPFGHNLTQAQIIENKIILQSKSVQFPSKPQISKEAQEFIKNCLKYDQNQRFDAKQAIQCSYMQKN